MKSTLKKIYKRLKIVKDEEKVEAVMQRYSDHNREFTYKAPSIINKDPKLDRYYRFDRHFFTDELINNVKKNTEVKDEAKLEIIEKVKEKLKEEESVKRDEMKKKENILKKNFRPGGFVP